MVFSVARGLTDGFLQVIAQTMAPDHSMKARVHQQGMQKASHNKVMKLFKHRHTIPRREQELMERMHKDRQQTLTREHDWCMGRQAWEGTEWGRMGG